MNLLIDRFADPKYQAQDGKTVECNGDAPRVMNCQGWEGKDAGSVPCFLLELDETQFQTK